jgi:hypothetical protein
MTACLCESCRPDEPAFTYTMQFRHECEVRMLTRMTFVERKQYIEGVRVKRGADAADALIRDFGEHDRAARELVDMASNAERAEALRKVETARGKEFAQGLRESAWILMQSGDA